MNTLIEQINIAALSKGEQSMVERINQKVLAGQDVTDKERQFIADMYARGTGSAGSKALEKVP